MAKTAIKLIAFAIVSLFAVSCTSLKCKNYVGTKEPIKESDLNTESIWQFNDTIFFVRVVDQMGTVSGLEWDESKKEYQVRKSNFILSKLDEHYFLNFMDGKDDLYTILRVSSLTDDTIAIFTVDKEKIERHIKEGKVKATKKEDSFILDLTKEELDNYMRNNLNDIFNYDAGGLLKQIKGTRKNK
jgi:hypothetical protein